MRSLNLKKVQNGLDNLSYTIKILVYQEAPGLMEMLDINDDKIFLEPLVFGYFNNPDIQPSIPLEQILYGYIDNAKKPSSVQINFHRNSAYLPNIGTIKLLTPESILKAQLIYEGGQLQLASDTGEPIPFELQSPVYMDEFEILTEMHPFFYKYFQQLNPETNINEIEIENITRFQMVNLRKAINIIRTNSPELYKIVVLATRKILLFDCEPINSFAIKDLQGLVFLSSSYISSTSFFIDDFIHQCSHNILNALIFDTSKYFKVNPELTSFKPYSSIPNETRNIYDTFHGLFTVSQRVRCFRSVYVKEKGLSKDEFQELIARYCDQNRRFRNGLQNIPISEIFTKKGSVLYHEVDEMTYDGLQEIRHFIETVDFSNQVSRFNYSKFCEKNNLLSII